MQDNTTDGIFTDDDLSPYSQFEKTLILEEHVDALSSESELPEGLSTDIWNKLVEARDRKITSERDARAALKRLNSCQALVSIMTEESDTVRIETEKTTKEYEQFLEYKFQNAHNVESLFTFKQGQVKSCFEKKELNLVGGSPTGAHGYGLYRCHPVASLCSRKTQQSYSKVRKIQGRCFSGNEKLSQRNPCS